MKTEIIKTEYVTELEKAELFNLFEQFYSNVDYSRFLSDFNEKHWLIRLSDNRKPVGFSTQQLIKLQINGKSIRILFSGDTIVHPEYWNKSHLAGAFGHLFNRLQTESDVPLYWFLISKGYRTYRFFPVFFKQFYPAYTGTNNELKPLLDAIAGHKFDTDYDPATELVEFSTPKDYLINEMAAIPSSRINDPHISFFLQRNPHYRDGTELAGIAPLFDNLTRTGERVIQTTQVEWNV